LGGLPLAVDGGNAEGVVARHTRVGLDIDAPAAQLQREGAKAFAKSWNAMLARVTMARACTGPHCLRQAIASSTNRHDA